MMGTTQVKQPNDHVDHRLERMMFFSDAVFAIAITLLVIEIKVPHLHSGDMQEAWTSLRALIPNFLGYILSFLVIGRFWMAHHLTLQVPEQFTQKLMWPNMILLLVVAFMPFATANMAENLINRVPMIFYNIILLALSLASAWVVVIATRRDIARQSVPDIERTTLRARSYGVVITLLLTVIASSFIVGGLSQLLLATMPLVQWLVVKLMTRNSPFPTENERADNEVSV